MYCCIQVGLSIPEFRDLVNCSNPFFLTLLGNELLTTIFERTRKNGLTSFGAPGETVPKQVDAVLISLVR